MTETREAATAVTRAGTQAPDWESLYRAHAAGILRYLRRLTKSMEAAEELMQETFARALRASRASVQPDEARRWLYRVATNVAVDRMRRERILRFVPFVGGERAPDRNADEIDMVRRALREIPPEQAAALVLRLHEGYTPPEIAAMLGIGEGAVRSRLVRGRRRFVQAYERMGGRL